MTTVFRQRPPREVPPEVVARKAREEAELRERNKRVLAQNARMRDEERALEALPDRLQALDSPHPKRRPMSRRPDGTN